MNHAKDFHSDGTKYIYAKFKDAGGNESAIAFARPPRIMYIQKGSTLAGRPALLQVRVAADLTGAQAVAASAVNAPQTSVASILNGTQVKTFYRAIGGSTYTEQAMSLTGDLYSLWIPGSQTINGVEYYFQVEDASGGVLATLPESNPSTQPFSLPAVAQLQEEITAGQNNAVEFAVGLTVQIPAGALAGDTQLQVTAPAATPSPPAGMTATDIGYALSLADGRTAFAQPITLTFSYADSHVAGMNVADLRAYYLDNGAVKYAGGTVDSAARTVTFETAHFTDFFLAEGRLMYPAPVTTATLGSQVTIQASVVNYVPVQSATLYYRVGIDGAWQSLAMSQVGDYYQATIPGSDVTAAGLAYYIQASDGSTTATFPAADPTNSPQVITVVTEPVIGVVKDPTGATVPGAFVSVHDRHYTIQRHDTTGAQGAFRVVGLPAGAYILEAQPPAGSQYSAAEPRTVNITDTHVSVDVGVVTLTAPLLTGTVKDPAGTTTIAGADVSVHSQDYAVHQMAQTGANGVFRIGGLGTGTYTLEASPPAQGPGSQYTASLPRTVTVTVGVGNDVGVVRLTEPQVSGRVYAPDGVSPVPNAWIMVESQDYTVHQGTNTDANGDFKLGGLIAGPYYLRASPPPGSPYSESDPISITVSTTPITQDLQLSGVSVQGTVYDPEDNPVPFAGVSAHNADFSVHKEAGSNEQGQYSIGGLAPGDYFLEIFSPFGTGGLVSPDPIPFTVVSGQTSTVNPQFVGATKRVVGKVIKSDSSGVPDVGVHAGRRDQPGYASAVTDSQGDFNLSLSGGTWDLMIEPSQNQALTDWAYTQPPKTVVFALDQTSETKTVTFTVTTANSWVIGSVRKPDGSVPLPYTVFIEVRDQNGAGNGGPVTSGDGSFSIPVPPGTYNVFVHCTDSSLGAPQVGRIVVGEGETKDLGQLTLVSRSSFIEGTVTRQSDGQGLSGVEVNAWQPRGSGFAFGQTTADGRYSLAVVSGTWEVGIFVPVTSTLISGQPPQRVTVGDDQTVTLNFTVESADVAIRGTVQDASGNVLTALDAFAYARRSGSHEPVAGVPVEKGVFTLNVPSGTYKVGVGLPPGARYTAGGEADVTAASGQTAAVTLSLLSNDARITGRIQDGDGQPITGVEGQVFAFNPAKGSWQATMIDTTDGSYSLNIAAGTWQVGYYVESSNYVNSPPAEGSVTVSAGQTVTKSFTLTGADYQISGRVEDPDGNALAGAWVFAHQAGGASTARVDAGTESGSDGAFALSVPAGTYMVGAGAPPEWGYVEPAPQQVTVSGSNPPTITLQFRRSDVVISGTVYLNGSPSPAFVEGWSGTGGWTYDEVGSDGRFSLNVIGNSTWHVRAMYEASGGAFYESTEETVSVGSASTTQNLTLVQSSQTIPDSVTRSFDATQPLEITLEDGSQIQIPASSLATSGTVTLIVTPKKADVPRTAAFRPIAFGYELSATDGDGQLITSNFNRNVVIVFYYTDQQLEEAGVTEDDLVPAYFSTTGNAWVTVSRYVVDKDNNKITMEINHFTTYGSGSSQQGTPAAVSDLGGSKSGNNLVLDWSAVTKDVNDNAITVDHYVVYRKANDPYFTPTASDIIAGSVTSTTYTDTSALGDTDDNYFYVIKAVSSAGKSSAVSKRVGEFDFTLTRDAYNTIVLPLTNSGLATADDLGAATGAMVVSRWVPDTQSLDSRIVGGAGENFSLSTGAAYFVYTPDSGATTFSMVGEVPAVGSVQFTIERAATCRLNLISLPLDQAGISTADGLATAVGGVSTVSVWQAATGGFDARIVGVAGNNFATRIGYPYWLCANTSGGGDSWP